MSEGRELCPMCSRVAIWDGVRRPGSVAVSVEFYGVMCCSVGCAKAWLDHVVACATRLRAAREEGEL